MQMAAGCASPKYYYHSHQAEKQDWLFGTLVPFQLWSLLLIHNYIGITSDNINLFCVFFLRVCSDSSAMLWGRFVYSQILFFGQQLVYTTTTTITAVSNQTREWTWWEAPY